jgi:hypothetical protein
MVEFEARLPRKANLELCAIPLIADSIDIADADVPLIHAARAYQVLAECTDLKGISLVRELSSPRRVVRRAVLMDGFVDPAMKRKIVFVTLEAGGGAVNTPYTRLLVDARGDREISHCFHLGSADMDNSRILERCI